MSRVPKGEQLDRIVAGVLVVQGVLETVLTNVPEPRWVVGVGTVLAALSIAVRRRAPLATIAALSVLNLAEFWALGQYSNTTAAAVGYFCGLYGLAVWTDSRRFAIGIAVVVASDLLSVALPEGSLRGTVLFMAVSLLAVFLTRGAVRGRQLVAEAHAARAELLEQQHEVRAQAAVAEERARIARELHDLVAHNVSVMVVQAGAERHALGEREPSTREVLASIEQAGRQALVEARRLLGMLRRDADASGGELEPQPSVAHIDLLIERVERAGLPVALATEGERVALPAGVDLCAYRIVQEGLTNALKHAGPARAEVVLRYAPRALDVEVRDDGRGPAALNGNGTGHGLVGMRERVALYGGELSTGPRPGGGFEIRAHLPLS